MSGRVIVICVLSQQNLQRASLLNRVHSPLAKIMLVDKAVVVTATAGVEAVVIDVVVKAGVVVVASAAVFVFHRTVDGSEASIHSGWSVWPLLSWRDFELRARDVLEQAPWILHAFRLKEVVVRFLRSELHRVECRFRL